MAKQSFAELRTPHLECRNLNHSWKHDETWLGKPAGAVHMAYHCTRCRTAREDVRFRKTGELLRRKYIYANSYLVEEIKSWGGRREFNRNVSMELMERYLKQKGG